MVGELGQGQAAQETAERSIFSDGTLQGNATGNRGIMTPFKLGPRAGGAPETRMRAQHGASV